MTDTVQSQLAAVAAIVNDYASWTASRWVSPKLVVNDQELASKMVMGFGLGGETGEVAEELDNWVSTGVFDENQLKKELGDAIYYWARVAGTFDFNAGDMFAKSIPVPVSEDVGLLAAAVLALKLSAAQGKVLEVCKKYVRDANLNRDKLADGLDSYVKAWLRLCTALGFYWEEVLQANRDKIEGRTARGTLRGSGNDR